MHYLDYDWLIFLFRYMHVLSGVMWIGLLWYFNFVQIPTMPKIPEEQRPAVTGHIAPEVCSGSAGRHCRRWLLALFSRK